MAWWGMADSGVAIRSQLLLCSPATNNVDRVARRSVRPRDSNVADRVENDEEQTADSEAHGKKLIITGFREAEFEI